jgi:hypothetical protein
LLADFEKIKKIKVAKEKENMQKVQHPPTTLPTMIRSQDFCNNILTPLEKNRAGFPLFTILKQHKKKYFIYN